MPDRRGKKVQWNMHKPLLLPQLMLNASNKPYEKKLRVFEIQKIKYRLLLGFLKENQV